MKSTSRPVKKKQTGLAAISPTYWLIGIVAVMVALALIVLVGLPAAATDRAKAVRQYAGRCHCAGDTGSLRRFSVPGLRPI